MQLRTGVGKKKKRLAAWKKGLNGLSTKAPLPSNVGGGGKRHGTYLTSGQVKSDLERGVERKGESRESASELQKGNMESSV